MALILGINEIKDVAAILSEQTGFPFSEVSLSFIKRRLPFFLERQNIRRFDQLLEKLTNNDFLQGLIYHMIVDTTEIFRDPGFWRSLNNKVFPEIIKNKGDIWFPDIASGEEVYSFLILLSVFDANFSNRIYANSPSAERIEEFKRGILKCKDHSTNENNFKRLELQVKFDDYIDVSKSQLVNMELINKVNTLKTWNLHAPFSSNLALVIFRNSMLYSGKVLQERQLAVIYNSLMPGGYLSIGIKENIPDSYMDRFEVIDLQERIFRKKIYR
jgi:chemotaxis methyl-accepting protein methylase